MKKFLMLLVVGTLALSVTGCKKEEENKIDDATKKVGDKVEEAAEKAKDAVK